MNRDIHATLKSMVVKSVSINLDPDKVGRGTIFSAEGKSELRIPKEENELSILLVSSIEIKPREKEDYFHASFVVNFFFSIDKKTDNYDEIVTEQCLPIIQTKINDLADKFLNDMGFPKFFETNKR